MVSQMRWLSNKKASFHEINKNKKQHQTYVYTEA